MLGIIGAMDEEVAKIKERLENVEIQTFGGMDFYKGNFEGKSVVVVRSGIGKVNAAVCAQILADRYQVSGGDIVLSTDALQHDMDATNFGYPAGQIPRMDVLSFPADPKLLALAKECCGRVNPEIHTYEGRVVSGDQFISDQKKKDWLIETFHGYCTEMEGAAIAQAAYLNGIPFLIIRAISDKADNSANVDYPTFEAQAIIHSVNLMLEMIRCYEE